MKTKTPAKRKPKPTIKADRAYLLAINADSLRLQVAADTGFVCPVGSDEWASIIVKNFKAVMSYAEYKRLFEGRQVRNSTVLGPLSYPVEALDAAKASMGLSATDNAYYYAVSVPGSPVRVMVSAAKLATTDPKDGNVWSASIQREQAIRYLLA